MTLTQIKALTDDELRVRVAELCGQPEKVKHWKYSYCEGSVTSRGHATREAAVADSAACITSAGEPEEYETDNPAMLDYPRSLDAMHEAEKKLTTTEGFGQLASYRLTVLPNICGGIAQAVSASARQRAEAFVLTLGT